MASISTVKFRLFRIGWAFSKWQRLVEIDGPRKLEKTKQTKKQTNKQKQNTRNKKKKKYIQGLLSFMELMDAQMKHIR